MVLLLTQMGLFDKYKCFIKSFEYADLCQREPISTLKITRCRKFSFSKVPQFSQLNNVLHCAVSSIHTLFGEIHVFLQLSWIGLFIGNRVYLYLENSKVQVVFLLKHNSVLKGNNVPDVAGPNTDSFLFTDPGVSSWKINSPIWEKLTLSPSWKPKFQEVFFWKSNLVVLVVKVLNHAACYINGFLWNDICVSSIKLIGLFAANRAYIHLVTLKLY
jgi:hypothetical protein